MTSPTVRLRRRRRLLALASAGLALCVGVSVTSLAAWQQNIEVAGGNGNGGLIGSSLLKLELSLDGGNSWNTASVGTNGNLNFGTGASILTPGDTVYASVLLRAAIGSRGATVKLQGGTVSDTLIGALTYAARTGVLSPSCNAVSFSSVGSTLVGLGTALTAGSGSTDFTVPAATSSAPGSAVGICLAVALPSGVSSTLGGLTTSPLWRFDATSA